jgi:tetratricopeptide (TPR) repeat protein
VTDTPFSTGWSEVFWKWIPEGLIQAVPGLKILRAKAAAKHAQAAAAAYDAHDLDRVIKEYSAAIELEPQNHEYLYDLGRIYYEKDELVKAEDCFRRALNISFHYAHAIKGLGYVAHRLGKIEEAIYCYRRYIELEPDDVGVHANLIAALEAEGRFDEAIAAGERAVQSFPSNADLVFTLGRNNYFAGKVDPAIIQLQKARDLDPENSEIYRVLGVALKTKGDMEGALANFQEAIKRNPNDADAHLAAAAVYQRLGRNEEYLQAARAARQLFEATKNDDALRYACWEEGWALYQLGRWEESVKASECVLNLDPLLFPVRFNLGLALLRLGQTARARVEYQKALEGADGVSLKLDGIDDLAAALKEDPSIVFGPEILKELETRYLNSTSGGQGTFRSQAPPQVSEGPARKGSERPQTQG